MRKIIYFDEVIEMLDTRKDFKPTLFTDREWWFATTKSHIAELIMDYPFNRKDYVSQWFDCDDFAFSALGHIRQKEADLAVFWAEIYIERNKIYHALLGTFIIDKDDVRFELFEPQNRRFNPIWWSDWKLLYLLG